MFSYLKFLSSRKTLLEYQRSVQETMKMLNTIFIRLSIPFVQKVKICDR